MGLDLQDFRHIDRFCVSSDHHAVLRGIQSLEDAIPGFSTDHHFFLGDISGKGVRPLDVWDYVLNHPNGHVLAGDWAIGKHILHAIDEGKVNKDVAIQDLALSYKPVNFESLQWTYNALIDIPSYFAQTDLDWKIHAEMNILGKDCRVLFCHGQVNGDVSGSLMLGRNLSSSSAYTVLKPELRGDFKPDFYTHFRSGINIDDSFLRLFGHLNDYQTPLVISGHTHTPHVIAALYDKETNEWGISIDSFDAKPNHANFDIEVEYYDGGFTRTYHNLLSPELLTVPQSSYERYRKLVFVVVGSAGCPRDGLDKACGAEFDLQNGIVRIHARPFDVAAVRKDILTSTLSWDTREYLAANISK